jgi:hypothetical protein
MVIRFGGLIMKNEFIPYELALELKQLGFDEPCFGYYNSGVKNPLEVEYSIPYDHKEYLSAPLYQQAFRWFRDVHNLKGGIEYIGGLTPETTWWDIYVVGHFNTNYKEMSMNYQSYEEAELACLKKLIEIVKIK